MDFMRLLWREPWLAPVVLNLRNVIPTERIETAGVTPDGKTLYYNPNFWDSLRGEEQLGLQLHEMLHIANLHAVRKGSRQHWLWNVACDMAINAQIEASGYVLPKDGLTGENDTAENIYARLLQNDSEAQQRRIRIYSGSYLRNGGVRQLYAPNAELKRLQGRILRGLLVKLPVSAYATAYLRKKNPVQNALPHVGKRYLLKLDITDFFGSIRFAQVYGAAFHTGHFPKQVGVLLTRLCCREGVLPQGAPTSPALSNLVLRNFDNNLGKWCASHDIAYTRYCDDMSFSSDQPLYAVYRKAKTMLEQMGFRLNEGKTRFITNANRQSVTGLTVNAKVSVSRDYKRKLRQEVHYVLKFGLAEHILRSVPGALIEGDLPNAGKYYRSLLGRVSYVLQIEPENAWFRNALDRLKSDSLLKGEIALWSM